MWETRNLLENVFTDVSGLRGLAKTRGTRRLLLPKDVYNDLPPHVRSHLSLVHRDFGHFSLRQFFSTDFGFQTRDQTFGQIGIEKNGAAKFLGGEILLTGNLTYACFSRGREKENEE